MNSCTRCSPSCAAMYRAGRSRSVLRSLAARNSTCARSRAASARSSAVNSSGPSYERPGIATMYASAAPASATTRMTALIQSVFELVNQVLHVLDAHRQAHQPVADAEPRAHVLGQRGVGHDRRMLDQALDAPQALGEREQLAALEEAPR